MACQPTTRKEEPIPRPILSRNLPTCLGKKARKPSENLGLASRGFYRLPRRRGAAPARRGGPPFSHPSARGGLDLIKPTTSHLAHNPLPVAPSPEASVPSQNPRRRLAVEGSRCRSAAETLLAPRPGLASHAWRRRCSSAPRGGGSSRPLSDL